MRRYELVITGTTSATYTSQINGQNDPGALNIEFDITEYNAASPVDYAHIRVWGVSLKTIGQGFDFNGAQVTLSAGMAEGLPLATAQAKYYGPILKGQVFQAFGNWIRTDQYLDLIVTTDGGSTVSNPVNLVVNWPQGQKMGDVVKQALQTAYPNYKITVAVRDSLVMPEDQASQHHTIQSLGDYLNKTSKSIITDPDYPGVNLVPGLKDNTFILYDDTYKPTSKTILKQDIEGQPTWIGVDSVQVTLVMRSDIGVGDILMFPQTQTTSTQDEFGQQQQDQLSFSSGKFSVTSVRCVGNFRQPDGLSWATVINATTTPITSTVDSADLPDNTG